MQAHIAQEKDNEDFMYCIDTMAFYYLSEFSFNQIQIRESYRRREAIDNLYFELQSGKILLSEFVRRLENL